MNKSKILEEHAELSEIRSRCTSSGKKIALCHGVFDLLHPGHFEHFRAASEIADVVVVSVTADEFVNKGPGRPAFDLATRMRTLSYIDTISYVTASNFPTALTILDSLRPDFYLKGSDYKDSKNDVTGMIDIEKEKVNSYGGQVVFTNEITSSSTSLINSYFSRYDQKTRSWIEDFKTRHTIEDISKYLDEIPSLRVGILGEIIIDRYSKCKALAKSSKDPILAFQLISTESYPGGILAIESNCQAWSTRPTIFSVVSNENLLQTLPNVADSPQSQMIEISDGQNTIVKHRFVDIDSSARLFETYEFDPLSYNSIVMERLNDKILEKESELDLLIIADYGHGLISKDFSSKLSKNKLFKAVNTQANAGNRGYNTITKYESADMISLNGAELQLELRERNPDYLKIVPVYMSKLQAKYAILTLGADGLMVFDRNGEVAQVPALAQKVIDKVGAGDSVLAMASLLAKLGAPPAIIGFVSSVVAAHEVSQLGHQSSLSLVDIRKAVKGVLG